ncbi:hypothetical protein PENTCL1PPCAC_10702 [Pristionchus entomophagus]|uniref:Nuclear receptor n=1 Tax=Pristionchus entomophagus TaxID=358040 RepID=A0AAV5SYX8_9BILA|nr:hypothetical protein PENTCL1PPCAC_10702 [Pristionchus entomophagus]
MDYALALKHQQANLDAKLLVAIRTAQAVANPSPDGCLVCGSPNSASPHFGSVSCLACAAFFRRTVALNITFNCKGNRQCQIYYELRMICRACRYEKCLRAGMKRHCVQKRRPSKHKKEEDEDEPNSAVVSPLAQYEMHMQAAGCSASIVKNEPISPSMFTKKERMESASEEDVVMDKKDLPFPLPLDEYLLLPQPHSSSVESYTEEDPSTVPSTSFSALFYQSGVPLNSILDTPNATANNSITTTPPGEAMTLADCFSERNQPPPEEELPFLKESGRELLHLLLGLEKEAMDRRRMMFTDEPLKAFTQPDGDVPYTRSTIKPHTLKGQAECVKFDHFLGFEYARKMPFVNDLNAKEKNMLLRFCSLGFSVLDIGYISSVVSEGQEEILVFTDGSYSTCGPGDFSVGWEDEEIISMEDKKKLFLSFNHCFFKQIIHPMRMLKMDRIEHAALKAICSWKLGLLEYTVKMKQMGKTMQSKILEGLIEHYREIGRDDIEVRIGEIYLLIGTLFEMYTQVTEMYKQLDIFNLLKVDSITKSLLCV